MVSVETVVEFFVFVSASTIDDVIFYKKLNNFKSAFDETSDLDNIPEENEDELQVHMVKDIFEIELK